MYLQRRNPNVPGISSKLEAPQNRKLSKVIKYWKTIMGISPVIDIYGNEILTGATLSIDHYEFWDLYPTTKSINSCKNNNLPNWNRYF